MNTSSMLSLVYNLNPNDIREVKMSAGTIVRLLLEGPLYMDVTNGLTETDIQNIVGVDYDKNDGVLSVYVKQKNGYLQGQPIIEVLNREEFMNYEMESDPDYNADISIQLSDL